MDRFPAFRITMVLVSGLLIVACQQQSSAPPSDVVPPLAASLPTNLEMHGDVRVDDYYWLRERESPDVIAYLEAENAYTEAMTAHTADLQEALYEEIKGRIDQSDESVPYRYKDYFYYSRTEDGKDYPIYARKSGSLDAEEEILVDVNAMAGDGYYSLRQPVVSTGQDWIAFAWDDVGRRKYNIQFKNLATGEVLDYMIAEVTGNVVWANDNQTVFYSRQDPTTLRWNQVFRHTVGSDPAEDVLVYEEPDEQFYASVGKTKSEAYIVIGSSQTLADEYRILDANNPTGDFRLFMPRERGHEYRIDHFGDHFYVTTNWDAENFRLMRTPVNATTKANWEEVIPARDDMLLAGIEIFRDFLVVSERGEALTHLRIIPWNGDDEHYLDFGEPAYNAWVDTNRDFDTAVLRYGYTSMTTPRSTYDYDMATREKTLLKQTEVLGDFSSGDYTTERVWATARDGERVPVSVVYRTDMFERDGTNPLMVYGYGSYGSSTSASFSSSRLSILDRGFVYAVAHIRGGQEMGRRWYEDGKMFNKMNTFTDFIDATDHLLAEGYGDAERVFARGGSAGGLLMGAVINLRPELYHGIVAAVPFVDVVTTMLDDSIPLTTNEYDEWGNPNNRDSYDYMLSYSPYDNVAAVGYPNMLVTTGLHDSQVQYWEPAKWVAKLRRMKTDNNTLLLKTNMEAGHGGASARDERYRETAFEYAWMLDLAGITQVKPATS